MAGMMRGLVFVDRKRRRGYVELNRVGLKGSLTTYVTTHKAINSNQNHLTAIQATVNIVFKIATDCISACLYLQRLFAERLPWKLSC